MNHVKIEYCTQCQWMLRAIWMGQELLTTFDVELTDITFTKGTGGVFDVYANGVLVFSRKASGRFPDIKELKQLVRDVIAPDKHIGHSEKKSV